MKDFVFFVVSGLLFDATMQGFPDVGKSSSNRSCR